MKKPLYNMDISLSLLLIIIAITVSYFDYMLPFMGIVFLLLSIVKLIDIKGFAKIFSTYDLFAKKYPIYGYIYPFIEFFLGICFLFKVLIFPAAIITFVIMTVGSACIAKHLLSKEKTACACLGAKFKVPLTRFTLVEDLIMAIMALILIF